MSDYTKERSLFVYLLTSFLTMFPIVMVSYWIDVSNLEIVCEIQKVNDDHDRMYVRINTMSYYYGNSYGDCFADFFRKIIEHYHLDWKPWVEFLQKRELV